MLQGYAIEDGRLRPLDAPLEALDRLVWVDLLNPTEEEEAAIEAALGIGVPTREEMEEIEESSRLYTENGAVFMTADLVAQVDTDDPVLAPVTFILAGERLVTLRYHEPRAFRSFAQRAERLELGCSRRAVGAAVAARGGRSTGSPTCSRRSAATSTSSRGGSSGRRRRRRRPRPTTRPCCAASAGWARSSRMSATAW